VYHISKVFDDCHPSHLKLYRLLGYSWHPAGKCFELFPLTRRNKTLRSGGNDEYDYFIGSNLGIWTIIIMKKETKNNERYSSPLFVWELDFQNSLD
jgi:hypothetical protein